MTRLMLAEGIDLSVVGPLAQLDAGGTDRLVLEGIRGDLVLLQWGAPDEAAAALERHGIDAHRRRHAGDPQGPATPAEAVGGRGIYYFDLCAIDSVDQLEEAIRDLRQQRSTRVFSLAPLVAPTAPARQEATTPVAGGTPAVTAPAPPATPSSQPSPPIAPQRPNSATGDAASDERTRQGERLDQLVDAVNDLDL